MGAGHGQKIVSRSCTAGTASKFNTQEYAAKKFSHCQSWRKREQDENKTCRSAGCRRSSTLPPKGRLRFGLRGCCADWSSRCSAVFPNPNGKWPTTLLIMTISHLLSPLSLQMHQTPSVKAYRTRNPCRAPGTGRTLAVP